MTTTAKPIDPEDADLGVGDCPVCGKYNKRIQMGRMKPCYMWQRIKEEEDDDDGE